MNQSFKNAFAIICILISFAPALSQTYQSKTYSEQDNLSVNDVYSIFQDSKGYLWIGATLALIRFDGIEFIPYTVNDGLLDNFVLSILEDHKGRMWFATQKGLNCLESKKFKKLTTREGLPDNITTSLAEDKKGNIWIGTFNGLSCYNGKCFKTYTQKDGLSSNEINTLTIDREGKLWIGHNNGMSCYTQNRFVNYSTANGLISNRVFCIFPDSIGKLRIGTDAGGCSFTHGRFTAFTDQDSNHLPFMTAIQEDNEGNLFLGTRTGLSIISKERRYPRVQMGLSISFVNSLLKDREGNIWIASYDGITCFKSMDLVAFSKKDGLVSNYVSAILEDANGGHWIGTSGGLNYYFQNQFKTYTTGDGLVGNWILSLIQDNKGNLWIGTLDGLSIFSSGKFINYSKDDGLASNYIFSLCRDQSGTIWMGTRNGVQQYRNGKFFPPPFKNIGNSVQNIIEDSKGNLWFSSPEGAYQYSPAAQKLKLVSTQNDPTDNEVAFVYEDGSQRIWIGTENGLYCKDGGRIKKYTTADGLPDNNCNFAVEDHRGYLWIGTIKGLSCFNGKTFETFNTKKNDLIANIWTCGIKDRNGKLWFGSPHGINTFTPPLKSNPVPPPVHINSVSVMGKEISSSSFHEFKHNRNNFKFSFIGICLTAPESVTYQFQLQGMNTRWTATRERSVFYPYLPPGYYTFRVKAYNNDGVESLKPAEFSFRILPPFWKTPWFISLVGVILVIALLVMYRFYFNWVEDKKRLKERTQQLMMSQRMELMGMLAAGAVHDMQNLLGIIIGYSNIIKPNTVIDEKNHHVLLSIKDAAGTAAQLVRQILRFSRQKITAEITPVNMVPMMNDILDLLKVIIPEKIQLKWDPPDEKIMQVMNPIQLQQIVMNLCINAVHAMPEGGTLTITLSKEKDYNVRLDITDTGCGMSPEVLSKIFEPLFTTKTDGKGTGLGLFVVQQLVKEYNGTIGVWSQPGSGTTFTLRFP